MHKAKIPFGKIAPSAPLPKPGKFDPTLIMAKGGLVPKYFAAGGYSYGNRYNSSDANSRRICYE
jgi:hypothetical protein